MGQTYSNLTRQFHEDLVPMHVEPTFDPHKGFEGKRKEREPPKATLKEFKAMGLPPEKYDYCADQLLAYAVCREYQFPFIWRCKHAEHEWHDCNAQDFHLRTREYERERRLRRREERLSAAA